MTEVKGYIQTADEKGTVNIGQNVIATIAAAAAIDVSGVCGLYQYPGREAIDGTGRKGISKGAKITIEEDNVTIDISLIAEVGFSVNEVAASVQKAVIAALEEAVGIKVSTVNVNVCGVSMKKQQAAAKARTAVKTENTGS